MSDASIKSKLNTSLQDKIVHIKLQTAKTGFSQHHSLHASYIVQSPLCQAKSVFWLAFDMSTIRCSAPICLFDINTICCPAPFCLSLFPLNLPPRKIQKVFFDWPLTWAPWHVHCLAFDINTIPCPAPFCWPHEDSLSLTHPALDFLTSSDTEFELKN